MFRFKGRERLLSRLCGTLPYVAPELLSQTEYKAQPADIWTCGIVLTAMLAGGKIKKFLFVGGEHNIIPTSVVHYEAGFIRTRQRGDWVQIQSLFIFRHYCHIMYNKHTVKQLFQIFSIQNTNKSIMWTSFVCMQQHCTCFIFRVALGPAH